MNGVGLHPTAPQRVTAVEDAHECHPKNADFAHRRAQQLERPLGKPAPILMACESCSSMCLLIEGGSGLASDRYDG